MIGVPKQMTSIYLGTWQDYKKHDLKVIAIIISHAI